MTVVPSLAEATGRKSFVESIVREVRRAFGELVFEPEIHQKTTELSLEMPPTELSQYYEPKASSPN